jgi:hypothetical protein
MTHAGAGYRSQPAIEISSVRALRDDSGVAVLQKAERLTETTVRFSNSNLSAASLDGNIRDHSVLVCLSNNVGRMFSNFNEFEF